MNMFTVYIFALATFVNVIAYDVNDNVINNISLSESDEKILGEFNNHELRPQLERKLRANKYGKMYIFPIIRFLQFVCAANEIKVDLECYHPELASADSYEVFTGNLDSDGYHQDLWTARTSFAKVERTCHPDASETDDASQKVLFLYKLMYASLIECANPPHAFLLTSESVKKTLALKTIVMKVNGLTESSDPILIDEALKEFAFFYARILHGANDFHHMVKTYLQKNLKGYLPEKLYKLHFLQAWNFSEKDLKYINALRVDQNKPEMLTKSYRFVVMEPEEEALTGILPVMDVEECHRF